MTGKVKSKAIRDGELTDFDFFVDSGRRDVNDGIVDVEHIIDDLRALQVINFALKSRDLTGLSNVDSFLEDCESVINIFDRFEGRYVTKLGINFADDGIEGITRVNGFGL